MQYVIAKSGDTQSNHEALNVVIGYPDEYKYPFVIVLFILLHLFTYVCKN